MASTRQKVTSIIRDKFPERAQEILDSEAFGALVYRVKEHDVPEPSRLFDALTEDDVEFADQDAENPAAFLAARIRDL
jgi:hypothetical protein